MSKKQYIVKTIAKGRSSGGTSASVAPSAVGGLTDPVLSELKELLSLIGYDRDNNAVYVKKDDNDNPRNFYTFGGMASGGKASSGSGGSVVSWTQVQQTGTHIATITINGVSTNVYAPNGGTATLQPLSFANKTYDGTTAKTITASDITTILGYTPVSSFNGRTGAVSLLKSDVESTLTGEIDSHYHTILRFKDARSVNPLPYATGFGRGVEYALRQNSADGVSDGGTYHGVMTLYQWNDMSGGAAHQMAFTDNGNIHTRYGKTEWSAWSILATREWVESKGYAVASSYLSKAEASATYLSISDASGTYHPKGGSTSLNFTANTLTTAGLTVIGGILSVQGNAFVDSGALTIGSANKSSSYLYLATATARMTTAAESDTIYIEAYTANGAHGKMALCGQYVQTLTELRLVANETTVSGVIAPLAASSFNLGKTGKPWLYIFANRWYPNPNDTDHYIDYNASVGAFRVNGNIYATGQVASGGITTSQGTSRIGVIKIGSAGAQYSPASDGICTIPLISTIKVGAREYVTQNGTIQLSWKIGDAVFVAGADNTISVPLTNTNPSGSILAQFGNGSATDYIRDLNRVAMIEETERVDRFTIPTSTADAMMRGDFAYALIGGDESVIYSIAGYDISDGGDMTIIYLQCGNQKVKLTRSGVTTYTYSTNW